MAAKSLAGTWLVLVLVLLLGAALARRRQPEYSEVDQLRDRILKMDPLESLARSGISDLELIQLYKSLGDDIEVQFPVGKYAPRLKLASSDWNWVSTQTSLRMIEGIYTTFRKMQQDALVKQESLNVKQWLKFANMVRGGEDESVPPAFQTIADNVVIGKLYVWAYKEASLQICDTQQSPQQLLYNLYNTIALTEMKGYAMMQFSYALLKNYNIGNFTEEMEQLKQQYAIRTSETLRAVKTAMAFAPRDVWKCDPSVHKHDVSYTELKQLFQGYIVNEVDMNPQGTCKETCGYYSYSKVYGCFKNQFCARQRPCSGKVLNCQYVDSDMWVCPSSKNSDRRYEYVEYENGVKYGSTGKCPNPVTKVDSWWRWIFWHCSYCMCTCDNHNSESERYFNMREVTSDIKNNMVVTGVRLQKVNQIVHIQIQEGELLERGNINSSSLRWRPIDNYTISTEGVRAGIDYHTIMWEKRAVDLDDLDSFEDHLLTGLRFRLVGAHLNLEIRMTPFNFTSGELGKEKSRWHSHDTTEASEVYDLNGQTRPTNKRTELKINDPDVPTRSAAQSMPDSKTNQYLQFVPTDLKKDVGQHTVPFIDIQAVEPKPPVPISGCGIFHKGRAGYGGFLALKLITYNFEPKLTSELPAAPPVIGMSNDVNSM